jgi:hypothetical protein
MKRAAILLALVAPVFAHAQIDPSLRAAPQIVQINSVTYRLSLVIRFGYPDSVGHLPILVSREEYAERVCILLQLMEEKFKPDQPNLGQFEAYRSCIAAFKFLGEALAPELAAIEPNYKTRVESIKQNLAKRGIIVEDPYAHFADVPENHWASDAIHNLRKLGILRGYPDNTFRG